MTNTLSVLIESGTKQDGTSISNSRHDIVHNILHANNNYFTPNGPDTSATLVNFPSTALFAAATRHDLWDGNVSNPVVGDASNYTRPTLYINRFVKTSSAADGGAVTAKVQSLAGSGYQANVFTAFMDQYASKDITGFGSESNMRNVGGANLNIYSQPAINEHVCTISNATPAVIGIVGHELAVNQEVRFISRVSISSVSIAASAVVTTSVAHGLSSGEYVYITGTNSTPVVDGWYAVTVTGATTFTVPVTTTVAGTAAGTTTSHTLPAGIATATRYFVITAGLAADSFEVSTSLGGAAVNTTTNGSGTFYVTANANWGYVATLVNNSYFPHVYNGSAAVTSTAFLVQPLGNALNGNALRVLNGGGAKLSEGIVFDPLSIQNETIYDASSSGIHDYILGTHTTLFDFSGATFSYLFNAPADATDPTGGGGAATGRISIIVAGVQRFLAYY